VQSQLLLNEFKYILVFLHYMLDNPLSNNLHFQIIWISPKFLHSNFYWLFWIFGEVALLYQTFQSNIAFQSTQNCQNIKTMSWKHIILRQRRQEAQYLADSSITISRTTSCCCVNCFLKGFRKCTLPLFQLNF